MGEKTTQIQDDYEYYFERHKSLEKQSLEAHKIFHTTLVTINAGALSLSVSMISNIGNPIDTFSYIFLILSWIVLIITIVLVLFGNKRSIRAFENEMEKSRLAYLISCNTLDETSVQQLQKYLKFHRKIIKL